MKKNTKNAALDTRAKFTSTYKLGCSAIKNIQLSQDAQILAESLISYIETKYPDFEFTDFYDQTLLKELRNLIKDKEEFFKFLDIISFSLKEFLEISTYVIPNVYTSHLIKFIRENYLNLPPKIAKK